MKTFKIKHVKSGKLIEVEQLATFAAYLGGKQFRFVVTRLDRGCEATLTHRASTKRMCSVTAGQVLAALGDYEAAGRSALAALVEQMGEARVVAALTAAES